MRRLAREPCAHRTLRHQSPAPQRRTFLASWLSSAEVRIVAQPFGAAVNRDRGFQATTIRNPFNAETAANPQQRRWDNVSTGVWRNSEFGNANAAQILRRQGVAIRLRGHLVN